MSVQPDFRSLLTEIDLILSRVISSLVNPRDISEETIERAREQLERARARLLDLSNPTAPIFWHLGIEMTRAGVRVAFFREMDGAIDLYPLSWSLEDGDSDCLPTEQIEGDLVAWLADLSPSEDSWLYEAKRELSGIWIATDAETSMEMLEKAILKANLIAPDRIHAIDRTIATALSHVSLDPGIATETLLVVQGGSEITELALVEIPDDFSSLSRRSIYSSRFDYGEETFTRDLLERAIYPRWATAFAGSLPDLDRLETHPLGQALREAAKLTRLILQERSEFTSRLGDREWTVSRSDVEREVILPFIARLQEEIQILSERSRVSLDENTRSIFCGDFFGSLWPLFTPALTERLSPSSIVAPPSPGTISPVLLGIGRVFLFPEIEDRSGNND